MRVISDDTSYTGNYPVGSPLYLTKNYINRVKADGGKIICSINIQHAFEIVVLLKKILGRDALWVNWCDASFGVKYNVTTGKVSKLYDLFGNDVTQSTTVNQPAIGKDSSKRNYLQFDGINDYMTSGSVTWNTDKASILIVSTSKVEAAGRLIASADANRTSTTPFWYVGHSDSGNYIGFLNKGNVVSSFDQRLIEYTNNELCVNSVVLDNSLTNVLNGQVKGYKNNVNVTLPGTFNSDISGNYADSPLYLFAKVIASEYTEGKYFSHVVLKEALDINQMFIIQNYYNRIFNIY